MVISQIWILSNTIIYYQYITIIIRSSFLQMLFYYFLKASQIFGSDVNWLQFFLLITQILHFQNIQYLFFYNTDKSSYRENFLKIQVKNMEILGTVMVDQLIILDKSQKNTRKGVSFRSSHPGVVLVKGVLKICSKFTGEHPWRSVISIKLLKSHFGMCVLL